MRSLFVAGLLTVAATAVVGGTAGAQADEAAAECGTSFIGQDPQGHLNKINGTNGTITDEYRTEEPVGWSPRAFFETGGSGGGGMWSTTYLAPSTDGDLRLISLRGTEGDPAMTASTGDTVRTNWNPHVLPSGTGGGLYTIKADGDVLMREVVYGSTIDLRDPVTLPVQAENTKAAGHYWIRTADDNLIDVIYATDSETGALRQIIVDPDAPASAQSYTLADTGYKGFTHLKATYCGGEAISVVGVNSDAGNARWFRHDDALAHSGSTLSAIEPIGTEGQWLGWTGIG